MQSLRFISEAVQDMTASKSLLSRSDTDEKPDPATDVESDADEVNYFDIASPDTRSEVSQYHDCQSEGLSSSSASQLDPTEEAYAPHHHGGVSPGGRAGSLWERWQAQVTRGDIAEEALRNHRQQHEQMSAQLFSLTQQHQAVSLHNQSLLQQNAALQADKAALEQRLQQQQAEREDELFVARWTTQRFYRSMAQQQVADEHQKEIRTIKQRYTNLHGMMETMREQQRQKENEEWERDRSWGYLFLQSTKAAGCVALGACGVLALIHVCEGREGLRALRSR
ncbi:hypothetical protein ABBQ38_001423 [Trebouxia sp. C0009 RCD-2024]